MSTFRKVDRKGGKLPISSRNLDRTTVWKWPATIRSSHSVEGSTEWLDRISVSPLQPFGRQIRSWQNRTARPNFCRKFRVSAPTSKFDILPTSFTRFFQFYFQFNIPNLDLAILELSNNIYNLDLTRFKTLFQLATQITNIPQNLSNPQLPNTSISYILSHKFYNSNTSPNILKKNH